MSVHRAIEGILAIGSPMAAQWGILVFVKYIVLRIEIFLGLIPEARLPIFQACSVSSFLRIHSNPSHSLASNFNREASSVFVTNFIFSLRW